MASSDYKKFNREIRAFVDVRYDLKPLKQNDVFECYYYNVSGRTNQLQNWQYSESFIDVVNRESLPYEYAILKQDYTKLNNEFFLFKQASNNCGFISQNTPNELETFDERNVIFEANLQDGLSGITLYFRNNTIKNANIKLYKQGQTTPVEREITDNTEERIFIDASDDNYTHIIIETLEWTNPNEKIWILKADLGLTYVYSNSELIEMNIIEEVNKLGEETPINELEIRIGDYQKEYDPLNPKGITKFLREDISTFIPYIGIVNEDGSIEYTKMGTFYFKSIEYGEKEVKLKAGNLIQKLSKINVSDKNGKLNRESTSGDASINIDTLKKYTEDYIDTNLNCERNIQINNSITLITRYFKLMNTASFLQNIAMFYGIFYIDRDEKIHIEPIDNNIKYSINKNDLLEDIIYTELNNKKAFNLKNMATSRIIKQSLTQQTENTFETIFTLQKAEEIICVTSDSFTDLYYMHTSDLMQTGATNVEVITGENSFYHMLFLKVTGNVGNEITIRGKQPYKYDLLTTAEKTLKYGDGEANITIDNPLFKYLLWEPEQEINTFLNKIPTYKINLDYNGNPFIKAGDYIEVESNYGTIPIFVQKHTLKYNGGLSGSIEGVE